MEALGGREAGEASANAVGAEGRGGIADDWHRAGHEAAQQHSGSRSRGRHEQGGMRRHGEALQAAVLAAPAAVRGESTERPLPSPAQQLQAAAAALSAADRGPGRAEARGGLQAPHAEPRLPVEGSRRGLPPSRPSWGRGSTRKRKAASEETEPEGKAGVAPTELGLGSAHGRSAAMANRLSRHAEPNGVAGAEAEARHSSKRQQAVPQGDASSRRRHPPGGGQLSGTLSAATRQDPPPARQQQREAASGLGSVQPYPPPQLSRLVGSQELRQLEQDAPLQLQQVSLVLMRLLPLRSLHFRQLEGLTMNEQCRHCAFAFWQPGRMLLVLLCRPAEMLLQDQAAQRGRRPQRGSVPKGAPPVIGSTLARSGLASAVAGGRDQPTASTGTSRPVLAAASEYLR